MPSTVRGVDTSKGEWGGSIPSTSITSPGSHWVRHRGGTGGLDDDVTLSLDTGSVVSDDESWWADNEDEDDDDEVEYFIELSEIERSEMRDERESWLGIDNDLLLFTGDSFK